MAFLFRRPQPQPTPLPSPTSEMATLHPFKAWTESLYITGSVRSEERLSDALNRRDPITVIGGLVVPIGAPLTAAYVQQEIVLDPFDFEFVLAPPIEQRTAAARAAKRIHKVQYPVLIEGTSFEVRGTIHLFAGNSPEFATHHTGTLFLPVTNPHVRRQGRLVSDHNSDVALVNRYAVRRIRQLDTLH